MKSRVAFIFLSLVCHSSAFADSQVYEFGKVAVEFWTFESEKITVSSHCIRNSELAKCDAIDGLKIVSFKKLDRAKFGGPNPGALICEQQLKGIIAVGIDRATQNENSFCKLSDGSLIDAGTLISYGIRNDRAAEREPNNVKKPTQKKKTK